MKKEINAKVSTFIFLLIVSALLFFFNGFGYLNSLKGFVVYIAGPAQSIFQSSSMKIDDFLHTLGEIDKFKKENLELRKKNLQLTWELSRLKELERKNEILKKQLGFSNDICLREGLCIKWKIGRVIGRNPDNYGKYVTVDLGKKQKIEKNQAVVISGGILIGKVVEVFDDFSRVMLITNSESSVNSITQTTRANGIVKGKYAAGVKLEMINQNEDIASGDLVITSGLEENVPKGLLIGKVSNIEESPNMVFKQADIELFDNLDHIEEIFIAIP